MKKTVAVILAAGRGTRMKSSGPKVMHEILGKPMLGCVIDSVRAAGVSDIVVVAGHGIKELRAYLKGVKIAEQKKLLGSGDAVASAGAVLRKHSGTVLVVCGDTPLIKPSTIKALISSHGKYGADVTVLTAVVNDPGSYGRMVRNASGVITGISEAANATQAEKAISEINVGTYCFNAKRLIGALKRVRADSKKKEYFLTDTIGIIHGDGGITASVVLQDFDEALGINTRKDLAQAALIMKKAKAEELMDSGVTIEDLSSVTVYPGALIGRDTVIGPNTVIEQDVVIGENCRIGPFARIRPGTRLSDGVEVGNFVELARARIGAGTKVKHHAYLGDAVVGRQVNIGAGTITANYDGKSKNKTIIGDGAFIGVGAILIAPVRVGRKAVVGAGCVVPKGRNVAPGATVVGVPAKVLKKIK
jgi:bifunctional UDP-N-acetylglucosamine pyrophosphorylase/glucosamine-1-phosphate N-acetyltransferase